MADSVFHADKVITQHISGSDFCTYFVGFDLGEDGKNHYRWKDLINLLQKVIPEFAFGLHQGADVPQAEITHRLAEAAKAIYKIDEYAKVRELHEENKALADDDPQKKYLTRGEFGELLLHLILRDFHETIPLISKIYFKDSHGATVHGFDAVHIQLSTKSLWLGESKLYYDGKRGIAALIEDIKEHIKADYLQDEFSIISKKLKILDHEIPEKQHWLDLMHESTKLADVLESVTIPILCTYTSDNFTNHDDVTKEFIQAYEKEVEELKKYFESRNDHPLKTKLNVVLMLFPVQSKDLLVRKMHNKLIRLQGIEDE